MTSSKKDQIRDCHSDKENGKSVHEKRRKDNKNRVGSVPLNIDRKNVFHTIKNSAK